MAIDLLFIVAMFVAIVKGLRQGLIVAVFSILGWMIGLAAAMKLSALAAEYLKESVNIGAKWLPVLSFVAVFIIVMLLVRLGAGILQKSIELSMMGWMNRIGGLLLYALLYSLIFSVILFFTEQLNLIKTKTIADSFVYGYIKPMGPWAINGLGKAIPVFKDSFCELQAFFGEFSKRIST